jgi:hypothetical protein
MKLIKEDILKLQHKHILKISAITFKITIMLMNKWYLLILKILII